MTWFTNYPTRKLEWSIATYTTLFGAFLVLPPVSMSTMGAISVLALMAESHWGLAYLLVGIAHALALHVNGRAAWTPFARLAMLIVNSQVFLAMALNFWVFNPWGTGGFTYAFISLGFCGPAIVAAAIDCGKEIKIFRARRRRIKYDEQH